MIAKPIQAVIPQGGKRRDEERFPERYPNIIDHQVPTAKGIKFEVCALLNRGAMLT